MTVPLFVCHANCARSVLACYLYRHLSGGAEALSAGFEPGACVNDHAAAMLRLWGIEPDGHRPRKVTRELCDQASAIFLMAGPYVHRLLREHGSDLAAKAYLFADPFTTPASFEKRQYHVLDPSFDRRPARDLVRDWSWMRERVLEIRLALLSTGRRLVPATEYLELCLATDPLGH